LPAKKPKPETVAVIHVSLDLETTGKVAGCGILSLGAHVFATEYMKSGKLYEMEGETFYYKIRASDNTRYGLLPDVTTIDWWMKQAPEVQREAFSGTDELKQTLVDFSHWLGGQIDAEGPADENGGIIETCIWGNDSVFDIGILQAAYIAVGLEVPWNFYNARCYRTLKASFPEVARIPAVIAHHALEDAIAQGRSILAILRKIQFLKECMRNGN
jgi:exodeoxyribonuclease VIII